MMTTASQQTRELVAIEGGAASAAAPAVLPQNTPALGAPAANSPPGRPSQQLDRDSYSVTALAEITDRALHAATARFTAGVSPAALAQAYLDWATHLACAPGKRARLVDKAMRKAMRFGNYVRKYALSGGKIENCIDPLPQDHRFTDAAWQKFPFNFVYKAFCCNSNGGTTPRPDCVASPRATRTWSNSPHGRYSTCSRRRISR
jgi:polyhydroxyalkanoate synthase subunit PhaC